MNQQRAVDPVVRSWQELEAFDLEYLMCYGQQREWLDDIVAPREPFNWLAWLGIESARVTLNSLTS